MSIGMSDFPWQAIAEADWRDCMGRCVMLMEDWQTLAISGSCMRGDCRMLMSDSGDACELMASDS